MATESQPTMSPATAAYIAAVAAGSATAREHSVMLTEINWDEYVALRDKPANRGVRMTYLEGTLEITTLGCFHELISHVINDFISEWRIAKRNPVRPSGSMTLRLQELDRGLEGDQSYYIQHESQVRGLARIDLENLPPRDLAVEVEHTSALLNKMAIYASLGVPEVWRWRAETLTVFRLVDGQYQERVASEALPGFPIDQLRQALSRRDTVDETTLVAEFREYLTPNELQAPACNMHLPIYGLGDRSLHCMASQARGQEPYSSL